MDFLSEATDACGIDILIADLEMVTCDDIGAPIEVWVGEWVITFTATDDYGNVSTCEMNLDLTLLGNQDNELSNAIALYPNPAGEQVTISNSSNRWTICFSIRRTRY